ncbi:MAG TPA: type II secretion system F family protein [Ktedonobacterales bacterium]
MAALALGGLVIGDVNAGGTGLALLLGLMIAGAIGMVFAGWQRSLDGNTTNVVRRLDQVVNVSVPISEMRNRRGRRDRRRQDEQVTAGNIKLARDLARADLKITVGEFRVMRLTAASVGFLLGFAVPVSGRPLLAALLLACGYFFPLMWVARRKRARQQLFDGQLADTITLMSGALRSGYSLLQAMELVAREGTPPISLEFDRVVREVGLGLSPEEALANLVDRMQSEDLELFVTAINVQREVGGNLVEVMETIANTIRERVKLQGTVRVLTSQQQFSGYIIALLPVGLAVMLGIINPTYMLGVFSSTMFCGWTMLGCSVVMLGTGFLIIKQIVNIQV